MKKKQLICSALAAVMLLGSAAPAAGAAQFPDSVGHWSASAIDRWSSYGVVVGANGLFHPDASITRGEMASIIAGMMGLEEVATNRYPDLNGGWYSTAMLKCVAAGIMTGDDHGQMRPYDNITGAEIAVMLTKALDLDSTGYSYSYPAVNTGYVKPWAQGYVNALASRGIAIGNDGGMFQPMANTNRAAVVSMFDRAVGTYVASPGTYTASGLTIVNTAGTVTLRGNASGIIVTDASDRVKLTLDNTRVTGAVEVRADEAQLTATDADISGNITVQGAKSRVSLTGSTEAKDITLSGDASDSAVSLARNTSAGTIMTSAPDTELSISGKVDSIDLRSGASSSEVEVLAKGVVTSLTSAANKVTISGDGDLKRATISGNNNSIDTPDTTVKIQSGVSGTRVDGVLKSSGSSTSSGSSSSSSSSSSRYTVTYRLANSAANTNFKLYDSERVYRSDYATDLRVPASLAPDGYRFAGWYTSTRGTKLFDFDTKIRDDYTLYGFWEKAPAVDPTPPPVDPKPEDPKPEDPKPEGPKPEEIITAAKTKLKENLNAAGNADAIAALMTVAAEDNKATVTFKSGEYTLTEATTQAEGENEGEGTTPDSARPAIQALAEAFKIEGWTAKVGTSAMSADALITDNATTTEGLNGKSVKVTLTKNAASDTGTTASAQADTTTGTTGDTTTTAPETFEYTITYKIVEPVTPPADETKASVANVADLTDAIANTKITEIEITARIETVLTALVDRNIAFTFSDAGELVLKDVTALPNGYTVVATDKVKYPLNVFQAFKLTSNDANVEVAEMTVTATIGESTPTAEAVAAPLVAALDAVSDITSEGLVTFRYGDKTNLEDIKSDIKTDISTSMNSASQKEYEIMVTVAGVSKTFTVSYVFSAAPTTNPPTE